MKRILIVAFVLLALTPATAYGTFPGRNGAIVYGQWSEEIVGGYDEGDVSLDHWSVVVRANDGGTTVLARCDETLDFQCRGQQYADPAVSPDGSRVVLSAGDAIALVSIGSGQLQRISVPGWPRAPAFSPDGTHLVYSAGGRSLWIVGVDGSGARRLAAGTSPTWSTRNWIAFVHHNTIYRVRPDGRGLRLLARHARNPEWSPDGQRLAFSRVRVTQRLGWDYLDGIQVLDADGGRHRALPGRAAHVSGAIAWSPDGRQLLVVGRRLLRMDLHGHVMQAYPAPSETEVDGVDWQALP